MADFKANRVPQPKPSQKLFWELTDDMPTTTRQLCEKARGQMGTNTANELILALRIFYKGGKD